MNILHICTAGPVTDGWNYQDNLLTKYQVKLGHKVTMITSHWIWSENGTLCKDVRNDYINDDGVRVIRLHMKGRDNFNKKIKSYLGLVDAMNSDAYDILFIHNVQHIDMPRIIRYINKNPAIKVFVDSHTDFSNSASNFFSKKILHGILWKCIAKMIEPYVTRFYGVLPARVSFLSSVYGIDREKIDLLVMGADDDEINKYRYEDTREEFLKEYGIEKEDFLIVTGGKIDEAKRQTILLMSAVHNLNRGNVKLLVFGSISDTLKNEVMKLIDNKSIIYVGWIPAQMSYRYFAAADLIVFPGRHSVFWEQVVGQGIPMLCKFWDGTTHVNICDNVKFIKEDTVEEISKQILETCDYPNNYIKLKKNATLASNSFRYSDIARQSIRLVDGE